METIIKLLKSITTWVVLGVIASGVLLYYSYDNMNDEKDALGFAIGQFKLKNVKDGDTFVVVNYLSSTQSACHYLLPVEISAANYSNITLENVSLTYKPEYAYPTHIGNAKFPLLLNITDNKLTPASPQISAYIPNVSPNTSAGVCNPVLLLGCAYKDCNFQADKYMFTISADNAKSLTVNIVNINIGIIINKDYLELDSKGQTEYMQTTINESVDAIKNYIRTQNIDYDNEKSIVFTYQPTERTVDINGYSFNIYKLSSSSDITRLNIDI